MTTSDDEKEPDARTDVSLPLRPITASRSRPPPGVNNSLPYSAKSWQRNVGVGILQHFPRALVPSKRTREDTPPTHDDDDDEGDDSDEDDCADEDGSDGSTTRPARLEDPIAILTELWGFDIRCWLPANLPYPPGHMSLSALHKWPSGVATALAELAQIVGDDAESRAEALQHVATAVAVRQSMNSRWMKTGGRWVARTDVEYAIARMRGDVEMVDAARNQEGLAAAPQYRSEVRAFEATQELTWVNNNWEGNLNPRRPEKRRKTDPDLDSDEGSVCSDSEIPYGVEFESFRLEKRNAALKRRIAPLKKELAEACRELDVERVRRQHAESFISMTRTSMSRYLGDPKLVAPEQFISDERNSMTSYLADAKKR